MATVPGVGATVASALIAAIGKGETFERGRDLAAGLGLVPRQFTTGVRGSYADEWCLSAQPPATGLNLVKPVEIDRS